MSATAGAAVHAHRQKQQPQVPPQTATGCGHRPRRAAGSSAPPRPACRPGYRAYAGPRRVCVRSDSLPKRGSRNNASTLSSAMITPAISSGISKVFFQNEGHHIVIQLPERTDGQKGQAHQERSLVIELHAQNLPYRNDDFFTYDTAAERRMSTARNARPPRESGQAARGGLRGLARLAALYTSGMTTSTSLPASAERAMASMMAWL